MAKIVVKSVQEDQISEWSRDFTITIDGVRYAGWLSWSDSCGYEYELYGHDTPPIELSRSELYQLDEITQEFQNGNRNNIEMEVN